MHERPRFREPKFIAELMAGKDPRVNPTPPKQETVLTVAAFLDQYFTNYVEGEGLKRADTVAGHIKSLKASLGELPVAALEKPAEIGRFKAAYQPLYRAIGVPHSRNRKPVPASRVVERLMLLDAVILHPELDWLATATDECLG